MNVLETGTISIRKYYNGLTMNNKLFKYFFKFTNFIERNILIFIGVIIGSYIGVCLFFYFYKDMFDLKTPKTLWDILTGLSSVFSSVGLVWIAFLTYRNQKLNAFQTEFDNLLKEHEKSLNSNFYNLDGKLNFHSNYLLNKITNSEANLTNVAKIYIYGREEVSRYFILLYRILDRIDIAAPNEDKKRYTGLLRVCIPYEILLLISINSLNPEFSRYKYLLEKFSILEHLPLSAKFISDIRSKTTNYLFDNIKKIGQDSSCFEFNLDYDSNFFRDISLGSMDSQQKEDVYSDYIYSLINTYFHKEIWGENIHIKKYEK